MTRSLRRDVYRVFELFTERQGVEVISVKYDGEVPADVVDELKEAAQSASTQNRAGATCWSSL